VVGESLGLPARCESLHVHDLAFTDSENHEPILPFITRFRPQCGCHDLVADLNELRFDLNRSPAPLLELVL
jgi:hypothetical protein